MVTFILLPLKLLCMNLVYLHANRILRLYFPAKIGRRANDLNGNKLNVEIVKDLGF